jgi:hypothetical protein
MTNILHRSQVLKKQKKHETHAGIGKNNSQSDSFLGQSEFVKEPNGVRFASCS